MVAIGVLPGMRGVVMSLFAFPLALLGEACRRAGRYRLAARMQGAVLTLLDKGGDVNGRLVAAACNNLAVTYKALARFDEAHALYSRALEIACRSPRFDAVDLAGLYHNLGGIEHARGRPDDGEPLARLGFQLRKRALGDGHRDVAKDAVALAALLHAQGRYSEAERLYSDALPVLEHAYGTSHYEVAVLANNWGALCHRQGRHAEAEIHLSRAVRIKERVLGPRHPELATTLNNLATVYRDTGRSQNARDLHERALAIFEHTLGPNHPTTVSCRSRMNN
jgi:tetratricopeptide (TPR) repeat protein